jgi:tRNA dimethylallyltransferase
MKNLIVIVGPTAVGKTALSIMLAKRCNGEIISADSMQIYKGMDIGTAKIKPEEMEGVPHYMINVVSPNSDFSVSDFKQIAYQHIDDICKSGHLPIVVGGTGLYINSLVYRLDFTESQSDFALREKYNNEAEEQGNEYIYEKLRKIDPLSAERLNINDRKRIIRALEIYETTGEPMSNSYNNFREENDDFNLIYIGLTMDRALLYERINERIDKMLSDGLVEEVKSLIASGCRKDSAAMKAIGYKEVISFLEGKIGYEEMVEELKKNSRRFAKRQMTWFRRDDRINWFEVDKYESMESLFEDAESLCCRKIEEGTYEAES